MDLSDGPGTAPAFQTLLHGPLAFRRRYRQTMVAFARASAAIADRRRHCHARNAAAFVENDSHAAATGRRGGSTRRGIVEACVGRKRIVLPGFKRRAIYRQHWRRIADSFAKARAARSEERRVGKECRSRWSP